MHDRVDLARYRFSCAEECLQNAKDLLALENQGRKASANRSYYAFFHAMRAGLALEGKDFKKHSALISYFRQQYMQPGVFPASCSKALTKIFRIRQRSDYEDFFLLSAEEAQEQIDNAEAFLLLVKAYLEDHIR